MDNSSNEGVELAYINNWDVMFQASLLEMDMVGWLGLLVLSSSSESFSKALSQVISHTI